MKLRKVLCIALVCLLLAGCGGKNAYTGDMEKALQALKWEDYDTAYGEADAFLERVPHSHSAQVVRETAAWNKLRLDMPEIELSEGKVTAEEYGFYVSELPEDPKAEFYLEGYRVRMDYDQDYFEQDFAINTFYLRDVVLYWRYGSDDGREFVYEIYAPGQLRQEDITVSLKNNLYYGSDKLAEETRLELLAYLQEVLVPSLNEVFKQIEKQTDLTPEALGFAEWNMPAEETGDKL